MPPKTTASTALSPKASVSEITQHIWQRYLAQTSQRTFLLDAFMAYLVLVGGIQFVYCVIAGNYPFNAFLAGFSAAVGQFVLTASLRMQTSSSVPTKGAGSKGKTAEGEEGTSEISHERAFADFIFGSLILHFFCINFIN
ncbi:oligosaccharyltransferase complex subunit epsilon [Talaromyces islandicus]|uniref:Dolichyl-diphosphooligosaccharide--protein glycosyltransferase subunit OST2 n=1 Tax=Talaromyces islandicus TaxID=28573 RepID=A0A0U1M3W7_TALIS|nr:oligosaccharyltransferase complex subunit epsilon [Talaromyces islandicus]